MLHPTITKEALPLSFGAFKPTGHVVVVLPDEAAGDRMLQRLGMRDYDAVRLSAEEVVERFKPLLPDASGASGFGSEIQSMRQIYLLALEGHAMMILRAPDTDAQDHLADAARAEGAVLAKKYGMLTIEELL